jgi:hypothetical protein
MQCIVTVWGLKYETGPFPLISGANGHADDARAIGFSEQESMVRRWSAGIAQLIMGAKKA